MVAAAVAAAAVRRTSNINFCFSPEDVGHDGFAA